MLWSCDNVLIWEKIFVNQMFLLVVIHLFHFFYGKEIFFRMEFNFPKRLWFSVCSVLYDCGAFLLVHAYKCVSWLCGYVLVNIWTITALQLNRWARCLLHALFLPLCRFLVTEREKKRVSENKLSSSTQAVCSVAVEGKVSVHWLQNFDQLQTPFSVYKCWCCSPEWMSNRMNIWKQWPSCTNSFLWFAHLIYGYPSLICQA